jgi:hypothetical protein
MEPEKGFLTEILRRFPGINNTVSHPEQNGKGRIVESAKFHGSPGRGITGIHLFI